ncbi:MAG TPA: hypothetical protein VK669_02795 [Candidatus Limnocylindrales bacterium]|nr:hypothetical protein [Candidatus Limnocylindrales bacterium]
MTLLTLAFGALWVGANVTATAMLPARPVYALPVRADYDGQLHVAASCATEAKAGANAMTKTTGSNTLDGRYLDLHAMDREPIVRLIFGTTAGKAPISARYTSEPKSEPTIVPRANSCLRMRAGTLSVRCLSAVAMLVLAAFLVRILFFPIRKREASPYIVLGFLWFVLGFSPMSQNTLNAYSPIWVAIAQNLLNDVFEGAGLFGLILFCEGWLRATDPGTPAETQQLGAANVAIRWAIGLLAAVSTACSVASDVRLEILREKAANLFVASQVLALLGAVFVILLIWTTYSLSDAKARARLQLIRWGFALGIPLYMIGYVSDNNPIFPFTIPDPITDLLYSAIVLVPASVALVMLRHHVMDPGLFISRGAVYAAVVAFIVIVLEGAIAWAHSIVESVPVLTVLAAFFVVSFHPLTEFGHKLLSGWLARDRVNGIRELRLRTRDFALARSFEDLERRMVDDATESLKLVGAALASETHLIKATPLYSEHAAELEELARDVKLREDLAASTSAVRLHRVRYMEPLSSFHDDVVPLVAVALENPGLPFHVFIVGPHTDGTDLDKEELVALDDFVERGVIAHLVLTIREIRNRIGMSGSPLTE